MQKFYWLLFFIVFTQNSFGQIDSCFRIKSFQKISDIYGNFTALMNNNDRFESICNMGDFNGDGINDILAGAKWDDDGGTDKGSIYILYMNGNGTVSSYNKISDTQGNFGGILTSIEVFGIAIDTIGDLNNDGVMDIVVGASEYNNSNGAIHVLFLNSNGTVQSSVRISDGLAGFSAGQIFGNAEFGSSLSCIGDLDGDGNNDLVVGAFWLNDGGPNRGASFIIFLNSNGTVKSFERISSTSGGFTGIIDDADGFGFVESLGDYNSDGIKDIAVGAMRDDDGGTNKGAVWILSIDVTGNVLFHTKISDTQGNFSGNLDQNDQFGRSISYLGDIDNDGIGDIQVGADRDDDGGVDKGATYILTLNANGTVKGRFKISDLTTNFTGNLDNTDWFGMNTATIGDIDTNGVIDLLVASPLDDDGGTDRGAFYIIFLENICSTNACGLTANFTSTISCVNDSTSFTNLSVDSAANIVNWQWYFGDGDSVNGVENPNHLYSSSGSYNVTFIVTNDSNCVDSITIPVLINPIFDTTLTETICQGDSILLGGAYQTASGNYVDSLQTVFGCDSVVNSNLIVNPTYNNVQNQTICQGDSILFGSNFYYVTGFYTDSLQTNYGCDSLLSLNLIVNPSFSFNQNASICKGDSLFLGGSFRTVSGVYTDSLQTIYSCDSLIITTLAVGDTSNNTVTVNICQGDSIFLAGAFQTSSGAYLDSLLTPLGCDSIVTTSLVVNSYPVITASDDTTIIACDNAQLNVVGSTTYIWSPFDDFLSCSTCANPIASPYSTTSYVVSANNNGCLSKDTVVVTVEGDAELIIPNVFSPNDDGVNDGFNLFGGCIHSVEKQIYNRWGQLLFHSNLIDEEWDGRTRSGAKASEGTYFYIFKVGMFLNGNESQKTFKGTVSLLR